MSIIRALSSGMSNAKYLAFDTLNTVISLARYGTLYHICLLLFLFLLSHLSINLFLSSSFFSQTVILSSLSTFHLFFSHPHCFSMPTLTITSTPISLRSEEHTSELSHYGLSRMPSSA